MLRPGVELGSIFGVGDEMLALGLVAGLFFAMIACLEIGRLFGQHARRHGKGPVEGVSTIDAALFALLGLLIAFTFSGAATRFDGRRELIRDEANAIGTAWLRVDLVTTDAQPVLRQDFRDYLDARLAIYAFVTDPVETERSRAAAAAVQARLWHHAVAATAATPGPQATTVLLPAINTMFDMATTRAVAAQAHPPRIIYAMLAFLALACSMTAGFAMAGGERRREWLHVLSFALSIALTLYVILDLEYPRIGLFTISHADQILLDVRASMGR